MFDLSKNLKTLFNTTISQCTTISMLSVNIKKKISPWINDNMERLIDY